MRRMRNSFLALTLGVPLLGGCAWHRDTANAKLDACYKSPLEPTCGPSQIKPTEPCLNDACIEHWQEGVSPLDLNVAMITDANTHQLSLEECIQYALSNSRVIRDLGGALLRNPEVAASTYEPAMIYSDPRRGEEAALSEFDTNFVANAFFENNDRQLNNQFFGNQGQFQQDLHNYQVGLNKKAATGTSLNLRHILTYDNNNQASNKLGPSIHDTYVEAEVRHPLMQGSGTEFNRIAGPGATPGNINGVLISRIRTDISLADFERSVRDLVSDVENAYWDLYFAYRDLEAKIDARDKAKQTLDLFIAGKGDRDGSDIQQAREQYLRFEAEVVDALSGRPLDATRTNNGSSGGTFRGTGGLRVCERRLRLVMGMPINDGALVRPSDNPAVSPVIFDWNSAIGEALERRQELRRQRWVVEQRKLELIANRNFLKPQLDVVGRYRFRGFGDDLVAYNGDSNAMSSLMSGDLQEWQAGLEYKLPIGFRKAYAAVRNSQLTLARDVELLKEQERVVHFGLSNAISELDRSRKNLDIQEQRLEATIEQINLLENKAEESSGAADVLLEAFRRLLEIRLRYYQSEVEYALAVRNVHFEKGSLLGYCNIALTESMSPSEAYRDASERDSMRSEPIDPSHRDIIVGR